MGRRFLGLCWLLSQHHKLSQHFELPIFGCELWLMDLLSQCLFDRGSSDMMHTSSQRGGVCVAPCRFKPCARHAHDERVLIRSVPIPSRKIEDGTRCHRGRLVVARRDKTPMRRTGRRQRIRVCCLSSSRRRGKSAAGR